MTQEERRIYLIKKLLEEQSQYGCAQIPTDEQRQRQLLRSLFNIRKPSPASDEFISVQNDYLQAETAAKGITRLADLSPIQDGIYLWQGDITTLECGAVVNAANSGLLGCFVPCHRCIDNAIHTFAGVGLRNECAKIMERQGCPEPAGRAKITKAYNLPCKFVLHTVGPVINGRLTQNDETLLASCYSSCLKLAQENEIESVAFCCISTGEFRFPNDRAAQIAVKTVKEYKRRTNSEMKVIFNVFKDVDYEIYSRLLRADTKA